MSSVFKMISHWPLLPKAVSMTTRTLSVTRQNILTTRAQLLTWLTKYGYCILNMIFPYLKQKENIN